MASQRSVLHLALVTTREQFLSWHYFFRDETLSVTKYAHPSIILTLLSYCDIKLRLLCMDLLLPYQRSCPRFILSASTLKKLVCNLMSLDSVAHQADWVCLADCSDNAGRFLCQWLGGSDLIVCRLLCDEASVVSKV